MVEMSIGTYGTRPDLVIDNIKKKLMPTITKFAFMAGEYLAGNVRIAIQESIEHPDFVTGALARSFKPSLVIDKKEEKGILVGSDLIYARIQDLGGDITPKKAKALTIPISEKAKRFGLSPRDWPSNRLFVWKDKETKKGFLAEKKGKKGIILHYVFSKHVRISPKGFLYEALEMSTNGIDKILKKDIDGLVEDSTRYGII